MLGKKYGMAKLETLVLMLNVCRYSSFQATLLTLERVILFDKKVVYNGIVIDIGVW